MYTLMELPYSYDALEPDISELTLQFHFNKHYKKYVTNLNRIVKDVAMPFEMIPSNIDKYPLEIRGDVLYNAGGVLNHELYFNSMGRFKSLPSGKLLQKINDIFGSFNNFKNEFISNAKSLVGSGYTFLVFYNGNLMIINLPNQETPLSYNMIPLFTIDLWEHAYYLDYKNDRDKYIENFFNKANFDYASKRYDFLA